MLRPLIAGLLVVGLAGCQSFGGGLFSSFGERNASLVEARSYSGPEALANGKEFYRNRDYGKAEAAFQRAVELMPGDGEAWLGLAASYDRLRRFDLADRAYGQAAQILGPRVEVYNNIGYSYLLRGDLVQARASFLKAYELAPSDPTVANNLAMLKTGIAAGRP